MIALISLFLIQIGFAAPNLTPGEIEVLMTQATIQYHSQNYSGCQSIVNKILSSEPENKSALELLALTQKSSKNYVEAKKTYQRLIGLKDHSKAPAYSFELATLLYNDKKSDEAYSYFEKAALGKFNEGASYFFMGLMDFNKKQFRAARKNLSASLRYPDGQPMKIVTKYYLGNTYAQLGKTDAASRTYFDAAQESKEEEKSDKNADQLNSVKAMQGEIRKNSLKELKAMDKMQKYINLTLMSQYDSNVQTNPVSTTDPEISSKQKSMKAVLSAAAGIVTSPVRRFQFMPSYRMFLNYNTNSQARDFNFISQTASLYSFFRPYSKLSYGLKTEGTYSAKNQLRPIDSRTAMRYDSYSLVGDIGPILKYEATTKAFFSLETTWRPKHYFLEPTTGETRRSGHGLLSKLSVDYQSDMWWWAPLAYLGFEWDNCYGKTYRNSAWSFGISNGWKITDPLTLTGYIDMIRTDYFENKSPSRDDFYYTFRVLGTYSIAPKWSVLADLGYTMNESTQPASFRYQRWVSSLGASYTF